MNRTTDNLNANVKMYSNDLLTLISKLEQGLNMHNIDGATTI